MNLGYLESMEKPIILFFMWRDDISARLNCANDLVDVGIDLAIRIV